MGRARAFSLVELLVVVAVLALLLAILAPTLRRTTMLAEQAVCHSNLHQLQTAQVCYSVDSRGRLPRMRTWVAGGTTSTWKLGPDHIRQGSLFSYSVNEGIYLCPAFARLVSGASRSYSMNWNLGNSEEYVPRENLTLVSQVRRPARMLLLGEENPWPVTGISLYGIGDGCLLADRWPLRESLATFHQPAGQDPCTGLGSAVFLDGHAELRPTTQTQALCLQDPPATAGATVTP